MANKIFSLLCIILFSIPQSFAESSEAEYRNLKETRTLLADGSQEYRCYTELTLFTHTAMNRTYGETFISYNPLYQELKIHASYTRQKDGNIVKTPENAFVEVLPESAEKAPAYNHLKEMVIVHTGLELGATLVLDYSIISKPGYLPEIDICQSLLKSSPVKNYELIFNVPVSKEYYFKTFAIAGKPVQKNSEDTKQISWTFRNLPAASRAPEVNLRNGDVPGIIFTTYASSQEALKQLYQQMDKAEDWTQLANQITKGDTTETLKLQAIHNYILNHIASSELSLPETGYRLRPASEVIRTAYGTAAERINLLNALLNASGIKATPAAAYAGKLDPEHCGLEAIRQFIILAEADGHTFRLSDYSRTPGATHCDFLLTLKDAQLIPLKSTPIQISYQAKINWANDIPEAETEANFSNNQLSYSPESAFELLSVKPDFKIQKTDDKTTITGKQSVTMTKAADHLLLVLPETRKGVLNTTQYARYNSKRKDNLLLTGPVQEEYSYDLLLPETLSLCTPSLEKKIENKTGSLVISVKSEGQKVKVCRALKLTKPLITPTDYPAFRQLITEWADMNQRQILLQRK